MIQERAIRTRIRTLRIEDFLQLAAGSFNDVPADQAGGVARRASAAQRRCMNGQQRTPARVRRLMTDDQR
jgi:hypothetical protein